MTSLLLILLGILLFLSLIVLHEYGHFLVAKRNGVKVKEFGIGLPPRICGKVLGKGIFKGYYSLNWLPIGGFVRLQGEHDAATGAKSYGSRSLWVKTKILLAGVFVNFLIAVFLFTILAWIGIPKALPSPPYFNEEQFSLASDTHIVQSKVLISHVLEDTPAAQSGLKLRDEVISIASISVINPEPNVFETEDMHKLVAQHTGEEVQIAIHRDNQMQVIKLHLLNPTESEGVRLGVQTVQLVTQRNTWSAPITGLMVTLQYTKVIFQGLGITFGALFSGDTQTAKDTVAGPVGIIFILKAAAEQGLSFILMIIALLSLTLAIMNALPIPALDGGRLMLTLLFRKILKKPLTKIMETRIQAVSMIGLLLLIVLITIVDVDRFLL